MAAGGAESERRARRLRKEARRIAGRCVLPKKTSASLKNRALYREWRRLLSRNAYKRV